MDYQTAAHFRMPIGKYAGRNLDDIGITNQGLLYLDWLRGDLEGKSGRYQLREALKAYLDDPTIAAELSQLVRQS